MASSIQGSNNTAATTATTNRSATMKSTRTKVLHAFMVVLLIGGGVVLANAEIGLFYTILTAGLLIFVGKQIKTAKVPMLSSSVWPTILQVIGWITLGVTLLLSGMGEVARTGVEEINQQARCAAGDTTSTCDDWTKEEEECLEHVSTTPGTYFEFKQGCKVVFNAGKVGVATLEHGISSAALYQWEHQYGVLTLTPHEGIFPLHGSTVPMVVLPPNATDTQRDAYRAIARLDAKERSTSATSVATALAEAR